MQHVFLAEPLEGRSSFAARTTDADGRARIAPILRLRPCMLRITPAGTGRRATAPREDDLFPRDIDPWTPKDDTVVLRRARSVEGSVRDTRGEAVTEGEICWEGVEGSAGRARVEYDGTFIIDRAPDGPVTLEFRLPETSLATSAGRRSVRAGDSSVQMVVDFGATLEVRIEEWPRVPGGVVHVTKETAGSAPIERSTADVGIDGRARVRGLSADAAYTVFVPASIAELQSAGAWKYAMKEHVRATDGAVTLALVDGVSLAGRVVNATPPRHGDTAVGGWATIDERGVFAWTTIDGEHDSGFVLKGVPSGTYEVRVVSPRYGWLDPTEGFYEGSTTVTTGTTDATVTVRRAPEGAKLPPPPRR
jgi:hypothetical protein